MKIILTVILTLVATLLIGLGIIQGVGLNNFASDEPHPAMLNAVISFARERFIASRTRDIELPNLDDPALFADGAAHYVPMCAGCHLGPGTQDTEIRRGLYPQPPNLAQPAGHKAGHDHSDVQKSATRQFWIIKHGIKMTGMPAWGATHDDNAIWGLVAFIQKLPEMTPEEFAALSEGTATSGHGHSGGHGHDMQQPGAGEQMEGMPKPADSAPSGHVDPPGAKPHGHGTATPPAAEDKPHTDAHPH